MSKVLEVDWSSRLQAAKHIEVDRLPEMMEDPEWLVRRMVARRIHSSRLPEMMKDPSWHVRRSVAFRISPRFLSCMFFLEHYATVRIILQDRLESEVSCLLQDEATTHPT